MVNGIRTNLITDTVLGEIQLIREIVILELYRLEWISVCYECMCYKSMKYLLGKTWLYK